MISLNIEKVGYIATPIDAIRGKVPGMVISQDGGNVNAEPTVRIRGTSSLSYSAVVFLISSRVSSGAAQAKISLPFCISLSATASRRSASRAP